MISLCCAWDVEERVAVIDDQERSLAHTRKKSRDKKDNKILCCLTTMPKST